MTQDRAKVSVPWFLAPVTTPRRQQAGKLVNELQLPLPQPLCENITERLFMMP